MEQHKLFATGLLFSPFLMAGTLAHAKPVSYKGSLGIMGENSHSGNRLMVSYSHSARFAIAGTYLRDMTHEFYIPSINSLLSRWNFDESQANLYLSLGPAFQKIGSEFQAGKFGEVQADWENRDFYIEYTNFMVTGYTNQTVLNQKPILNDLNKKTLRLGFSPFKGEYTELNSWFIVQFEAKKNSKSIEKIQLLRFFYRNVLWEIGADFKGGYNFNYMINL